VALLNRVFEVFFLSPTASPQLDEQEQVPEPQERRCPDALAAPEAVDPPTQCFGIYEPRDRVAMVTDQASQAIQLLSNQGPGIDLRWRQVAPQTGERSDDGVQERTLRPRANRRRARACE
jgi:hypothetical protein